MVKEIFETLLEEAGKVLNIPDLHPDKNHSCLVRLPNGLNIQIEMDPYQQGIILGCDIGGLPAGKYRENVFREALKINGQKAPHHGILAYSNKTEHMVLYELLPLKDLTGEKIADAIAPFAEKALLWKEALARGETPVLSNIRTSGGMFGLRP